MLIAGRNAHLAQRGRLRVAAGALIISSILGSTAAVAAAAPSQSWNNYKWARTGALEIKLGNNVSSVWKQYLTTAGTQWSAANNIDFLSVAGTTTAPTCAAKYGTVQACSGNYGANGWLGYTNVWTSGGFIVQAVVKLNDYYFSTARYNTDAWRATTACHEVGHTLGLAHTNEVRTNANTGSCMDYTNDPSGLLGSNGNLANTAPNSVDFAALNNIYAQTNATQLAQTRPTHRAAYSFSIEGFAEIEEMVAVPEPATWALLIVGFGLTGTTMRRQRRIAVAA